MISSGNNNNKILRLDPRMCAFVHMVLLKACPYIPTELREKIAEYVAQPNASQLHGNGAIVGWHFYRACLSGSRYMSCVSGMRTPDCVVRRDKILTQVQRSSSMGVQSDMQYFGPIMNVVCVVHPGFRSATILPEASTTIRTSTMVLADGQEITCRRKWARHASIFYNNSEMKHGTATFYDYGPGNITMANYQNGIIGGCVERMFVANDILKALQTFLPLDETMPQPGMVARDALPSILSTYRDPVVDRHRVRCFYIAPECKCLVWYDVPMDGTHELHCGWESPPFRIMAAVSELRARALPRLRRLLSAPEGVPEIFFGATLRRTEKTVRLTGSCDIDRYVRCYNTRRIESQSLSGADILRGEWSRLFRDTNAVDYQCRPEDDHCRCFQGLLDRIQQLHKRWNVELRKAQRESDQEDDAMHKKQCIVQD